MSLHGLRPWLVSMGDVMVDPKRSYADVVRDIMTGYDTVCTSFFITVDLCI